MVENRVDWSPTYAVVFLPLFFGLGFTMMPEWTQYWWHIVYIVSGINLLVTLILKLSKVLEGFPKRVALFQIIEADLTCLAIAGMAWRLWGESVFLGVILGLTLIVSAVIAHKYRRVILQEVIFPKTKIGKIIVGVGAIGGGAAGTVAYTTGHLFGDSGVVLQILPFLFIPISIYILVVFHAAWLKVEEPNWQPKRFRSSR